MGEGIWFSELPGLKSKGLIPSHDGFVPGARRKDPSGVKERRRKKDLMLSSWNIRYCFTCRQKNDHVSQQNRKNLEKNFMWFNARKLNTMELT